jgi:electron transfer flavoprotein-quinone oxidoreductase
MVQQTTPYALLEGLKAHPAIRPLIQGSEMKEYAAHLIPEGGYHAIPAVYGEGWLVAGDAGMFVNAVHREGSNLAMTSGRLAAETVLELHRAGQAMSANHLAAYRARLDASIVIKDLKKYRRLPGMLDRNRQFLGTYPALLNRSAHTLLTVDGDDKRSKERQVLADFRAQRGLLGLLGDAYKLWRATR